MIFIYACLEKINTLKVELMPSTPSIKPTTVSYGTITEIRDNCVIAESSDASQLIPIYRFIKEDDKAKLCVGAKVKVNRYYSNPASKRLLSYNAELTTE